MIKKLMTEFPPFRSMSLDSQTDNNQPSEIVEVLDNIKEGCQIIDFDYKYFYVNNAAAKQNRKSKKELLGRKMTQVYPSIKKTQIYQVLKVCMTHRIPQKMESELVFADGTKGWFELRMEPVENGVLILSVDITKRVENEKQIYLQNTALKAAANGVVITDMVGNILWVNPAFSKLTGYPASEAIGKHTRILKSNKQDPAFYKDLWNTINAGKVWSGELINRRKDGSFYNEEQTITPVKDENGKVICFIAIKQDVTTKIRLLKETQNSRDTLELKNNELQKTEKNLIKVMKDLEAAKEQIELEKFLDDAMLASIGLGVFAVDKNAKFILVNKKAEELLGIKASELVNKKTPNDIALEYNSGEQVPAHKRPTYLAMKHDTVVNDSSYCIVHSDGSKTPIALTITPIKNKQGQIIGAIDVFRDITEELEIDRAKSDFVSIASHQLRTPLGISKWYLEAIQNNPDTKKLPKTIQDYLAEIYKSNERLLELVRNLLLVSRIDQNRVKDAPKLTDLTLIIDQVVKELEIMATNKKLTLKYKKLGDIPSTCIDPTRFQEVIENLIVNAIKYNRPKGSIDVCIAYEAKKILISVKDTGIGVANKDIKNLFGKFYRTEKASLSNPEGSGLGLYVVKSYVESWEGSVTVESKEGKGSTFTVTLPLKKTNFISKTKGKEKNNGTDINS